MIKRLLNWLLDIKPEVDTIPSIANPLRMNRIIKSMYERGEYEVVHPVLHHYLFVIDGKAHVLGIAEVLSAIRALDEQ